MNLPFVIKTTKHKKQRTKTRRRKGGEDPKQNDYFAFEKYIMKMGSSPAFKGINYSKYLLWHARDPIKYKTYDDDMYYPHPNNKYNPLNQLKTGYVRPEAPEKWQEKVIRHCKNKNPDSLKDCIRYNCNPSLYHSSCDVKKYVKETGHLTFKD